MKQHYPLLHAADDFRLYSSTCFEWGRTVPWAKVLAAAMGSAKTGISGMLFVYPIYGL